MTQKRKHGKLHTRTPNRERHNGKKWKKKHGKNPPIEQSANDSRRSRRKSW